MGHQGTQAPTLIHPCCELISTHTPKNIPLAQGGEGVFGHPPTQNFQNTHPQPCPVGQISSTSLPRAIIL